MLLKEHTRTLVYDIEANGLLDKADKIWCLVAIDYDTNEISVYHDYPEYDNKEGIDDLGKPFRLPARSGSLKEGVVTIHKCKSVICHNQLGYDQFLMKKFYPQFKIRYNYPEIRDTLLESQVQMYDRKPVSGYKGIHGLEPWAARLGNRKPKIEDWSYIDAAKINRCIEDVKNNVQVAKYLERERQKVYTEIGLDFTDSLKIEHEYRYYCTIQELNGAKVDADHMRQCVTDLVGRIAKLREELEPMLPPTIETGEKITKQELFSRLGLKKKIPIEYKIQERAGEVKTMPVKEWLKPTTNFTNLRKGKLYSIMIGDSELKGCTFDSLKEARKFVKENLEVDKKVKVRYPNIVTEKIVLNKAALQYFEKEFEKGTELVGSFTKINLVPSRMSQHAQVKLWLVSLGWNTTDWTLKKDAKGQFERADTSGEVFWPDKPIKGYQLCKKYKAGDKIPVNPKIIKESFATLPEGIGEKIKEFNTYVHRLNFIENQEKDDKGLLSNIRDDGRITCGITGFGTTAGRASHSLWVNAPGLKAVYGKQIRRIIVAEEGHHLIGVDMPSAHPRILADFTNNETFIKAVDGYEEDPATGKYLGEDFHTVNSVLFKINSKEDIELARETQDKDLILKISKGRGKGKGGSYSVLYGASGEKVALTLNLPLHEGEPLKQEFLSGLGLDNLLKEVEEDYKRYKWAGGGFIPVLGNYFIFCKSKHKFINYKALGSEAVVQKVAIILVGREMQRLGLKSKLICSQHDECLFEAPDDELEIMKNLASNMYPNAAKHLGLTLNWSSAAKVGKDYSECH